MADAVKNGLPVKACQNYILTSRSVDYYDDADRDMLVLCRSGA